MIKTEHLNNYTEKTTTRHDKKLKLNKETNTANFKK